MDKFDIFGLGFIVGILTFLLINLYVFSPPLFQVEIDLNVSGDCNNLSFTDTNYCLNRQVKSIYRYNDSNHRLLFDVEALKRSGGNCVDWSKYYCQLAGSHGFDCQTYTLQGINHMIAISQFENETSNGYCLLDQRTIKCVELLSDNEINTEEEI